jgi:hypothetical protein
MLGGVVPPSNFRAWLPPHYSPHPDGSRIAFERHAGMVSQYWAIENLAQFIRSGATAAPELPR